MLSIGSSSRGALTSFECSAIDVGIRFVIELVKMISLILNNIHWKINGAKFYDDEDDPSFVGFSLLLYVSHDLYYFCLVCITADDEAVTIHLLCALSIDCFSYTRSNVTTDPKSYKKKGLGSLSSVTFHPVLFLPLAIRPMEHSHTQSIPLATCPLSSGSSSLLIHRRAIQINSLALCRPYLMIANTVRELLHITPTCGINFPDIDSIRSGLECHWLLLCHGLLYTFSI